uniref:Transcription initiation factor TFIID subunit 1 n=1 Tax=Aceria tosichella TaxID=561515 RepID=A0A6G1SBJ4_9ACAR
MEAPTTTTTQLVTTSNATAPAALDSNDCFHMISQLPWEEEIVWDGQEEAPKIMAKAGKRCQAAGWIPSAMHRRASDFSHQIRDHTRPQASTTAANNQFSSTTGGNQHPGGRGNKHDKHSKQDSDETDTAWYSIFPVDNEDLVYGVWERDIIWDPESTSHLPIRRFLTLDPNDENIIFQIPEDKPNNSMNQSQASNTAQLSRKALAQQTQKEKKENLKRSKIILGKSGVIVEPEIISPPPDDLSNEKQPWNISNDEYYSFKAAPDVALKQNVGNLIQHSTPAVELRQPFFPTFINRDRLGEFHRPPLFPSSKRARATLLANDKPHPIESLTQHIAEQAQLREKKRLESGGGEMFFMHSAEDLSGRDAELILAECSEEYPPLLNQVGMATKIKNYARRKPGLLVADQETELLSKYEYGEPVIIGTSPFLGTLAPGQSLQTIENNMYRAPIYKHKIHPTDFLVIRSQDQFWIREVQTIFTVGQELPIIEVPGPNSKKANNFIRDFLQVYIYRMFRKSPLEPKRIKMDDIKKAFPLHSESSIRKRLKQCADFNRTGDNPNMWYLKKPGEFRLPQEAEIRTIVTPEQCCAYYSMLAAERRLQDAGYGEKSLCTLDDDDDEDKQREMDDEVKAAPWNTTRAFIAAMKQKCLLQLTGVADPTGCNEGFSYVRVPNKPLLPKEEAIKEPQPKKTVTGTDADLRRLKLSTAKAMLRDSGIPEDKIEKLPRWQVIHLVRELSTKQVRAGEESMSKFARGNRFSIAEHQERYKEECQRIFDLQNKILASDEVLSTDDEESNDDEDPDIEQGTKTLEFAIENKKTSQALFHEREEAERRDLHKMMFGDDTNSGDFTKMQQKKDAKSSGLQGNKPQIDNMDESSNIAPPAEVDRILNIYRTYRDSNGREYVRVETVRKPAVIESYIKIRETKNAEAIKEFAMSSDDPQRETKRKERKQTVRKERMNHDRRSAIAEFGSTSSFSRRESPLVTPKTTAPNSPSGLVLDSPRNSISPDNSTIDSSHIIVKKRKEKDGSKLRCSACGGLGHMKNNRSCPARPKSIKVAMTREELEEEEQSSLCAMDIIKTEDTKILINKKYIDKLEETRKKSLKLRIPIGAIKKRRTRQQEELDYLKKPDYKNYRSKQRG